MANNIDNNTEVKGDAPKSEQMARRKFLAKSAAVTVPVILTVTSRPAMGGNFCTPSGFLSGNLSNTGDDDDRSCNGLGPHYWKRHFPRRFKNVRFSRIFGGVWVDGNGYPWDPDTKLEEVLEFEKHEDRYRFGANAVAVYLNAEHRHRLHYPMDVGMVTDIVRQVLTMGMYTNPSTGMTMDVVEVKSFFKGTYH